MGTGQNCTSGLDNTKRKLHEDTFKQSQICMRGQNCKRRINCTKKVLHQGSFFHKSKKKTEKNVYTYIYIYKI